MAGNAGAAPILAVDPNSYVLVSQAPAPKGKVDYSYTAEVVNSGSAANGVSAAAKAKGAAVTVTEGNLSFDDVAAGGRKRSTDTFTIRRDPAQPWGGSRRDTDLDNEFPVRRQSAAEGERRRRSARVRRCDAEVERIRLDRSGRRCAHLSLDDAVALRWQQGNAQNGNSVSKTFNADRAGYKS